MSKQIKEAVEAYFQEHLKDVISDPYWRPLREDQAKEYASAAVKLASEEMDGCITKVEVSDHCIHWVADLTINIDGHEEVAEVSFNRIDPSNTHTLQVYEFLTAFVKAAIAESGSNTLNLMHIHKVGTLIDNAIDRCEGCKANMSLEETLFRNDNLFFRFKVLFSSSDPNSVYAVYFEVPWPLS